mgnify:CR=1 FL=1
MRATDSGEPITSVQRIDAKFIGTDSTGIVQGMEIITVQDENAVLNNVSFVESGGQKYIISKYLVMADIHLMIL